MVGPTFLYALYKMIEIEQESTLKPNNELPFDELLKKLRCQFLSCYPLHSYQWENLPQNLSWEQQEMLLKNTVGQQLNRLQPIKLDYQLNFLKRLIQVLEKNSSEVHDDIYNEYCKTQQKLPHSCTEELVYKHYLIPEYEAQLTMLEAKSFVGRGTTGLCTWQASLALADFLLHNPDYVKDKNVFELGAGTGLCGMILNRCNTTKQVTLTDGSLECVDLMRDNIKRNFPHAKETDDGFFETSNQQALSVFHLPWENIKNFRFTKKLVPDLILAADVVYDDYLFEALINAIDFIFKTSGDNIKMLLSATVRNEETLEEFLNMVQPNFAVKDLSLVPESERYLHWDRTSIIRILEITRQ